VDPVVAVLAVLVMLVGLFGVVIPVLPGLLLVWLTSVGTTLWMGTDASGWAVAALLTVMFAAGTAASIWLPARQGRRGGAPTSSLAAAALGAFVGFFLIPVVGLLIGGGLGFVLAEFRRFGEWQPAFRSLARVIGAYGIGVLIELVIGVMMIGTWVVAVILR
jgi:uncharacterized protein